MLTFDRFVNKTCCDCFVLNFDLERSRQCLDNEQSCPKVVKPVHCLDWSQICRKLCDQEAPFCPDCRDGAVFKVFRRCNYGAGKKLHCDRMHTKVFCFKNFCCHFFRALSKNHDASVDKVKNLSCGSKPVLMQYGSEKQTIRCSPSNQPPMSGEAWLDTMLPLVVEVGDVSENCWYHGPWLPPMELVRTTLAQNDCSLDHSQQCNLHRNIIRERENHRF